MAALEGHIYQAIDKQVKATEDEPDVNPMLRNIRDGLERHVDSLKQRIDALGGQATSPLKDAGASHLGIAAGVIDKLRAGGDSKEVRDDYAAVRLSNISYVMLVTAASARGTRQNAH